MSLSFDDQLAALKKQGVTLQRAHIDDGQKREWETPIWPGRDYSCTGSPSAMAGNFHFPPAIAGSGNSHFSGRMVKNGFVGAPYRRFQRVPAILIPPKNEEAPA
jgi:hypothetical protein